jgi:hypothetical protein
MLATLGTDANVYIPSGSLLCIFPRVYHRIDIPCGSLRGFSRRSHVAPCAKVAIPLFAAYIRARHLLHLKYVDVDVDVVLCVIVCFVMFQLNSATITLFAAECPLYQFPKGVVEQIEFLVTVIGSIRQLLTSWLAGSDQIQELCGLTQPPKYFEIAQITSDQLCALATILEDLRLYMQCGNWYPLYTKTVYDAMCYSGTEGFAWVAATQCIVVFMAMILLTARCAFYDLEILILEPDESSHRETSMKLERRPETNQEEEGGGDVTSVVNGIAEIPERWEEWEC